MEITFFIYKLGMKYWKTNTKLPTILSKTSNQNPYSHQNINCLLVNHLNPCWNYKIRNKQLIAVCNKFIDSATFLDKKKSYRVVTTNSILLVCSPYKGIELKWKYPSIISIADKTTLGKWQARTKKILLSANIFLQVTEEGGCFLLFNV